MVGVGFVDVIGVNSVTFALFLVMPWEFSIRTLAFLVASSRSGTIALTAAWKASSRELCAGFAAVFGFDVEDFGRTWSDGLAFWNGSFDLEDFFSPSDPVGSVDSTVSSHGFVFAVIRCACCFVIG